MEAKKLEFRGGSAMSLIPFIFFIVITIVLSFANFQDINMMVGAGVVGLLIGMIFCKNIGDYWDVILTGLGSKVAMTAVMLWLVVGIYGSILKSGHIVEGLVWLSVKLGVTGSVFTVAAFIFAALFAVATGSGFGTISTMSFILYPAGILLGANPAVLAGAILSGAAFGDNFAPVSDTTIIAATSQEYTYKKGTAEIGGTVKARFKYVVVAGVIAIILFAIFGGSGSALETTEAQSLLAEYQMPLGLLLLIPTLVVIIMAIRGINIFACLGTGIVLATVIGLAAGLFDFSAIVAIEDGSISGAISGGVAGMFNVSILLMVVVSMGNLLIASGCMESVVNWLNNSVIKSETGAELALFCLSTIFGILIAAINTIANICVAPFINAIGKKNGLHPHRRANILATTICSFPFFLPYGGCVLLLLGGVSSMMDTYTFLPQLGASDMMFTAFYSWAIWIVMLVCCITGIGRTFEGKNGEEIKSKTRPQL
ncbi:MAG: sodium:proton antiporter [Mogibacterium sp.]|nr:sodium:proton antiporter [Mogibacterium sp.]